MREIKFRAWDKKQNCMDDFSDMFIRTNEDIYEEAGIKYDTPNLEVERVNTGRYEIMQYTGLKDKNGKEIYEGDIVIMKDDPEDIGSVAWDSHDMEWVISMATTECKMGGYWSYELEVIGNIHDNPELLEASND